MGLYSGPPENGRLELGPTRNQTRPEPEFKFSAKRRWSVSNPQLRLRPFDQIPASRTWGIEKWGRIGRVKERKERGKGREVNKVSCSLPVGAVGPVVRVRRRPGTKGSQLPLLGLVHWQASWPWVPRVVRMSVSAKKSPTKVAICCRNGDPFQGPKLGSCLTLRNEFPEETHLFTKQEILLAKGTWVESSRVRETRRTALPRGSQSRVLWWWD